MHTPPLTAQGRRQEGSQELLCTRAVARVHLHGKMKHSVQRCVHSLLLLLLLSQFVILNMIVSSTTSCLEYCHTVLVYLDCKSW
jgi:hypothetical protein